MDADFHQLARPFRRSLAAVVLGLAGLTAAQHAQAQGFTGAILFSRPQLNPDSTVRSSSLWLATPTGARALTAARPGVLEGAGSWSPDGAQFVFERGHARLPADNRYDLSVYDRRTRRTRLLTHGPGSFQAPAWGTRNRIAFVAKYRDRHCLGLIDANGGSRRDLFCPPSPTQLVRPVWSADGARILIAGGYYVGQLEPVWRSLAYEVDATTGAPRVLDDQIMDEPRHLEFAPDGRRGLYSGDYVSEMTLVDFRTKAATPVGYGYAPRWSRDGRRIAFTGEVFEVGPEFRYYEPLYVMNADGTQLRRLTGSRVNNHAYFAVDWSRDGRRILANRRLFDDPALTLPRYALRIVNVGTRVVTAVADGYAEPGAWFEP